MEFNRTVRTTYYDTISSSLRLDGTRYGNMAIMDFMDYGHQLKVIIIMAIN